MANKEKINKASIGGQALIEGVMMNGPHGAALSVRHTDGNIITEEFKTTHIELKLIINEPIIGLIVNPTFSNAPAATGMQIAL